MTKPITKDVVVFYHGLCRDGFTAAWAAWKKFGDSADYVPVIWTNQSEQIPAIKNKEIYFLDYCPSQEKLNQIVEENKSVCVIDHHVSRETVTKSLPGSVYDISHSGAVLAWNYFHPNVSLPQLCRYVEDSDLWKWEIAGSAEVLQGIDDILEEKEGFQTWEEVMQQMETESGRDKYSQIGKLIIRNETNLMDQIVEQNLQLVEFEGFQVYAVNAPRHFRSVLGNRLVEMKPPFGIVWSYLTDEITVSLRAKPNTFNLIPLVEKYGGGGHEGASNFRLPLGTPLPWKVIKQNNEK